MLVDDHTNRLEGLLQRCTGTVGAHRRRSICRGHVAGEDAARDEGVVLLVGPIGWKGGEASPFDRLFQAPQRQLLCGRRLRPREALIVAISFAGRRCVLRPGRAGSRGGG